MAIRLRSWLHPAIGMPIPDKLNEFERRLSEITDEAERREAQGLIEQERNQSTQTVREAQESHQAITSALESNDPTAMDQARREEADVTTFEQRLTPGMRRLFILFKERPLEYRIEDVFDISSSLPFGREFVDAYRSFEHAFPMHGAIERDETIKTQVIRRLRGSDKSYTVLQGFLYVPFVEEQQRAVGALRENVQGAAALLGTERGGALLAEEIASGLDIETRLISRVRVYDERQGRRIRQKSQETEALLRSVDRDCQTKL